MPLPFNKPVLTGYRSYLGLLPDIRKHYSQDTVAEMSVRSGGITKDGETVRHNCCVVCCNCLVVSRRVSCVDIWHSDTTPGLRFSARWSRSVVSVISSCRQKIENSGQSLGPTQPQPDCVDRWLLTIRSWSREMRFECRDIRVATPDRW